MWQPMTHYAEFDFTVSRLWETIIAGMLIVRPFYLQIIVQIVHVFCSQNHPLFVVATSDNMPFEGAIT